MDKLRICHLYPDLLNLYGDRGNIIAMKKRLEWRNIGADIEEVSVGSAFDPESFDIVFIGGGQDFEQEILLRDLGKEKKTAVCEAVEAGVVFLAICGGYQLLGTHYESWDGVQFDFTGAIDIHTIGREKRMIGDFMFTCTVPGLEGMTVTGFENHSGRTYLGASVKPLGKILKGYGNNGTDGTAGAVYNNVFCSYSHGPILPKNPALCDHLLATALERKYGSYDLGELDDSIESSACEYIIKRLS